VHTPVTLFLHGNPLVCDCSLTKFIAGVFFNSEEAHVTGFCDLETPIVALDSSLCMSNSTSEIDQKQNRLHELPKSVLSDKIANLTKLFLPKSREKSFLRPDLGVGFDNIASIIPNIREYSVYFHITWPNLHLPDDVVMADLSPLCGSSRQLPVIQVCTDYYPILQSVTLQISVLRESLRSKLADIRILLTKPQGVSPFHNPHSFQSAHSIRSKRSENTNYSASEKLSNLTLDINRWDAHVTGTYVTTLIPPVAAALNTMHMSRRFKHLEKIINIMIARQDNFRSSFIDISEHLASSIDVIADKFQNTSKAIKTVYKNIKKTGDYLQKTIEQHARNVQVLRHSSVGIKLLSILSSTYSYHWQSQLTHYRSLLYEADLMLQHLQNIYQNKVSPLLVPPSKIKIALDHVDSQLKKYYPDMQLVTSSVGYYYNQLQSLLISPVDDGLFLHLGIPVQSRQTPVYALYSVQTTYVPVNTNYLTADADTGYTKIELPHSLFGISSKTFIQLDEALLKVCTLFGNTYLCYASIPEIDLNDQNCLVALYRASESVMDSCSVKYYPELHPGPTIMEMGGYLLLANLESTWSTQCGSDFTLKQIRGPRYAVIPSSVLCNCTISAQNIFISKRIDGCHHSSKQFIIKHTLNTLALKAFLPTNISFSTNLTDIASDVIAPKLDPIDFLEEDDVLIQNLEDSSDLRKLSTLIRERTEVFRTTDDKLRQKMQNLGLGNFNSWWTLKGSPFGAMFIMSAVGALSFLMVGYLCCRQNGVNGMITSLIFANAIRTSKAHTEPTVSTDHPAVDLSLKAYSLLTLSHFFYLIAFLLVSYFGKQFLSYLKREAYFSIKHPALRKGPRCHFYLEFFNATDRVLIYLFSLHCHVHQIKFKGHLTSLGINIMHYKLFSVASIDWEQMQTSITVRGVQVPLPSLVRIPLLKVRKIKASTSSTPYSVTALVSDHMHFYEIKNEAHSRIIGSSEGPYSGLIRELQTKNEELSRDELKLKAVPSSPNAPHPDPSSS
jgi:hypothetical protein